MMLVLSRKVGEKVLIGDRISIMIVSKQGRSIRLGIEAPKELVVTREDMREKSSPSETKAASIE